MGANESTPAATTASAPSHVTPTTDPHQTWPKSISGSQWAIGSDVTQRVPDCPPGSRRIGTDSICHAESGYTHDEQWCNTRNNMLWRQSQGYSAWGLAGPAGQYFLPPGSSDCNNPVHHVPNPPPPHVSTVVERQNFVAEHNITSMPTTGHATRTQFTPSQIASLQEEVIVCDPNSGLTQSCTIHQNNPPNTNTGNRPVDSSKGASAVQAQSTATSHTGTAHDPAPPMHETPKPVFHAQINDITTQVDAYNLAKGVGGDSGASREKWLGPKATEKGITAHYLRMTSGNIRGATETEMGDHGEPSLQEQRVRNVLDWLGPIGVVSRAEQGFGEVSQGNPHAWEATKMTLINTGLESGGMALGAIVGAGGRAASNALRAGATATEKVAAQGIAKGLTTNGHLIFDSGLEAVNGAEHATLTTSKYIGKQSETEMMELTGMERRPTTELMQRLDTDRHGGVVREPTPSSNAISAAASKMAQEDIAKFDMREARMNLTKVAEEETESSLKTVTKAVNKGVKNLAVSTAFDAAALGVGTAIEKAQNKGEELETEDDHALDPDGDTDMQKPRDGYGVPVGHKPQLPGEGEKTTTRTSTYTTPNQKVAHNTYAQYQQQLAENEHPPAPELFGGPVTEPVHPHQSDMTNTYLFGALALGGILIASRA